VTTVAILAALGGAVLGALAMHLLTGHQPVERVIVFDGGELLGVVDSRMERIESAIERSDRESRALLAAAIARESDERVAAWPHHDGTTERLP
jgi:hypothetical protein